MLAVSYINVPTSRVHALNSVVTNKSNKFPTNFGLMPNYASLVANRSLSLASCQPGKNNALHWE